MTEEMEKHKGRPFHSALDDLEHIVRLSAEGKPVKQIASIYNVTPKTIYSYLKRPEAQEHLAGYRELIRQIIMQGIAEGIGHGVMKKVQQAIDDGGAKDVDAATRAVLNIEKAAASASGENRKVEVSGPGGQPLQIDARAIIAQIIAHNE